MSQKTHQPFCNFKSLKRTGRFKPKVEHDSHAKEIPFNPLQITLESQPLMGKRRFSRFIQKTGKLLTSYQEAQFTSTTKLWFARCKI